MAKAAEHRIHVQVSIKTVCKLCEEAVWIKFPAYLSLLFADS